MSTRCPDCNNIVTEEELDRTWDWSGPHCPHCGCTGMGMFASVQEQKGQPIMSGRDPRNIRVPVTADDSELRSDSELRRNPILLIILGMLAALFVLFTFVKIIGT